MSEPTAVATVPPDEGSIEPTEREESVWKELLHSLSKGFVEIRQFHRQRKAIVSDPEILFRADESMKMKPLAFAVRATLLPAAVLAGILKLVEHLFSLDKSSPNWGEAPLGKAAALVFSYHSVLLGLSLATAATIFALQMRRYRPEYVRTARASRIYLYYVTASMFGFGIMYALIGGIRPYLAAALSDQPDNAVAVATLATVTALQLTLPFIGIFILFRVGMDTAYLFQFPVWRPIRGKVRAYRVCAGAIYVANTGSFVVTFGTALGLAWTWFYFMG
jgi:hypothetical protein